MKRKIVGIILFFLILIMFFCMLCIRKEMERCSPYESFVLVGKNNVDFKEEWYTSKWGMLTDVISEKYITGNQLNRKLERKLKFYKNVKVVFLEIPVNVSETQKFEKIMKENPQITFYVYCKIEPIEYWQGLSAVNLEEKENQYNDTYKMLNEYDNVVPFEFYNLEWILNNPKNYLENGSLNETVSYYMFCAFARHIELFEAEKKYFYEGEIPFSNPYENMLVGKTAVVFGDSIWDLNRTSTGAEKIVEGLSGIEIYNYASGGSSATSINGNQRGFLNLISLFKEENKEVNPDYILIEYGLNDYFSQVKIENKNNMYDENTYKGALRAGIKSVENIFPNAQIVLLGPTTIQLYDFGKENILGEGTLKDYEYAMKQIALEFNCEILCNYDVEELNEKETETFLELDCCHLNENGMYIYGERIVDFLCDEKYTKKLN